MKHYNGTELLNNKIVHIYHHRDMDGISCAVMGRIFMNADLQFGYDYYDNFFNKEEDYKLFNNCTLIFTDVVPKFSVIEELEKYGNSIVIIDHHSSMYTDYLKHKERLSNTTIYYAENICASLFMFQLFTGNNSNVTYQNRGNAFLQIYLNQPEYHEEDYQEIGKFLELIVDKYDLYKFEKNILDKIKNNMEQNLYDYLPVIYNSIFFNETMEFKDFTTRINHWYQFIGGIVYNQIRTDIDLLSELETNYQKYIDEHNKKISSEVKTNVYSFADTQYKVALIFGDLPSFYSYIYMKQNIDADFSIYLNHTPDKSVFGLSLRSIHDDMNVQEIARKYFSGGGHIRASGGSVTLPQLCSYLNI